MTVIVYQSYSSSNIVTLYILLFFTSRLVIPLSRDPIDVQSAEPFFSDPQFTSKWRPEKCFYKYRSKEDFMVTCGIIDKPYVIGVNYKVYKYNNSP